MPVLDKAPGDPEREDARNEAGTCWFDAIASPGLYLDPRTGALFRVPGEETSLRRPRPPAASTTPPSVMIKLSDDPFLSLTQARIIASDRGLRITF